MTDDELERQLRYILDQINDNVNILKDYIEEIDADSDLADIFAEISGKSLEEMMKEQQDSDRARNEASRRYFEGIKKYMDGKHWRYRTIEESMILVISFGLTNLVANVFIIIEPIPQIVSINTVLPVPAQGINEEITKSILADLNYACRFGSYQYDNKSGSLSYYYAYSFLNQEFDTTLFENYLYSCLIPPDEHFEIFKDAIE